jgi:two-component system response regulator
MTNKLILLIEDNASDEKLTLHALKNCGVANDVVVRRDGAAALSYLLGDETKPAEALPTIVLLDLKLPKLDGLEVLRAIRAHERTKLLPVIVLTASKQADDVTRCYQLGANAYVRKPVDFVQFTEATKVLGTFWLQLNEPPHDWRLP